MKQENYVKIPSKDTMSGDTIAGPFQCNIGARQGDSSSPIIFSLYINDLVSHLRQNCSGIFITQNIPDILCLLFAEDVACGADTVNNLHLQLNAISNFVNNTK